MHNLILWAAQWLSLLFSPGTGTHRRGAVTPPRHRRSHARPARTPAVVPLPRLGSPYREVADTPIDATATALVRPYFLAHERERERERQREQQGVPLPHCFAPVGGFDAQAVAA